LTQSKQEKIRRLKEEIKMIKSHQNVSNWDLLEDMIDVRSKVIEELINSCFFCEKPCDNNQCEKGGKSE
jgi:uncharacterized Fe-S radical SAM superfamily protein PflX